MVITSFDPAMTPINVGFTRWGRVNSVGAEEALEGVARGGVDGDAVLAVGQGGDVDSVVAAVDLGGDHRVKCGQRDDFHVIVLDLARAVDNDGLRHIIIIHVGLLGRDRDVIMVRLLVWIIQRNFLWRSKRKQTN